MAPPASAAWLEQQWETARIKLRQSEAPALILAVDEIQKIPNWSETVKANWDADTRAGLPLKVLLLGSSRLLLQQGLTESLVGRFELSYIGHWSFAEMEAAFDFSTGQYAWFGGYSCFEAFCPKKVRYPCTNMQRHRRKIASWLGHYWS